MPASEFGSTDIDQRDENGWSALHHAADRGEEGAVRSLLHQSADPNLRTGDLVRDGELRRDWFWDPGLTALILAAERGHASAVRTLIELGASAALHDVTYWGPLHAAVIANDAGLVTMLIDAGADVNLDCQRRSFDEELSWYFVHTPLHLAALRNSVATALALVEGGADVSAAWIDRRTPLIFAAARGSTGVVELLCKYGADPNLREHRHEHAYFIDYTPLHYAARNGHRETADLLVRLGAEIRVRDSHSGLTPEELAREYRAV